MSIEYVYWSANSFEWKLNFELFRIGDVKAVSTTVWRWLVTIVVVVCH